MSELENPLSDALTAPGLPVSKLAGKTLNVTSVEDASKKVSDIEVIGNGNSFQLLCKASSKAEGWMKSAKAYEIPTVGCLVQVTTQQNDHVAEALVFVEGVTIEPDINGGKKLVKFRRGSNT